MFPLNKTPNVETTLSFAINPLINDVTILQSPNPNGEKTGTNTPATIAKMLCAAIETNPSSNYLIGTIKKYDEHPIFRFNSRKLKKVEPNMQLSVSINTDDQGVFDTLLENEYALMALALKKKKDKNNNKIYDIEDIYEWIDYVRKMGIEQSFKSDIRN